MYPPVESTPEFRTRAAPYLTDLSGSSTAAEAIRKLPFGGFPGLRLVLNP